LFVWRAGTLLDEMQRVSPELSRLVPLLREGRTDEFFALAPTLSIDHAVLERSGRVGVMRATFDWDDVGSWDALRRTRPMDADGNVVLGDGYAVDSRGLTVYADDGPVVAFGVEELVIVRTGGVTFVTHRDRTPELKQLLAKLPEELREL
ncbi:MAG TPA: hypothetical protein VE913_13070, partial [Longimicrobium sp.]|nr:hypothetical protein [Longimicrobium sp.]